MFTLDKAIDQFVSPTIRMICGIDDSEVILQRMKPQCMQCH